MLDILSIGDATIDHFFFFSDGSIECRLDQRHCQLCIRYGDKIPVHRYSHSVAGNAANVAVACARLGMRAGLATIVGDDSGGREILHRMNKEEVQTRWMKLHPKEHTNSSSVLSFKGERTILVYHAPREWKLPKLPKARWYYLTSIGPRGKGFTRAHQMVRQALRESPATRLALNPGTYQFLRGRKFLDQWIVRSTIVFLNKEEAEEVLGLKTPTPIPRLLALLRQKGAATPVITDGANGAWALDSHGIIHCPSARSHVVERTGAGDSFAASVVAALNEGRTLEGALQWGASNSASVITHVGPIAGLLKRTQLLKIINRHPLKVSRL